MNRAGIFSARYRQQGRTSRYKIKQPVRFSLRFCGKHLMLQTLYQALIARSRENGSGFRLCPSGKQKGQLFPFFNICADSIVVFFPRTQFDYVPSAKICQSGTEYFPPAADIGADCRNACVIRTIRANHIRAVMLSVISGLKSASVVQIHENLPVILADPESFPSIPGPEIRVFPVHRGDRRHVFRFFHSPFNFK